MSKDKKKFIKTWKVGYLAGANDGYKLCVPTTEGERVDKLAEKAFRERTKS